MRIVSYNARGLRLGQSAGDKARRIVIDQLFDSSDMLCIQETMLSKQDLERLNSVHNDFYGAGESTTDLSLGLVRGRISGGVAIFWQKKYDPVITVIRLDVDWAIAIKVSFEKNDFIILNVYTPFECHKNENEFLNRLGFISSFITESECTCIFAMGDLNADVSDNQSLFGQHLQHFCQNSKLVLSSKVLMPENSYTYISEAWHTTSWLDHCICTADAHDCLSEIKILYDLSISDHIPVSMLLNLNSLPALAINNGREHTCRKIDWAKLSQSDLRKYNELTDYSLSSVHIPHVVFSCDANCQNPDHQNNLVNLYENIVKCLIIDGKHFIQDKKKRKLRPGWNEYVAELHSEAKEALRNWVAAGKVKYGPEFQHKKATNARFKYAVRYVKINEQMMKSNSMARKLHQNDVQEFWNEVKVINNSKMPLPSTVNGVSGDGNIAELWATHFGEIFNCVESAAFKVDDVGHDASMVIRPDEVCNAIGKLAVSKASGPDEITAEHLKYASYRLSVLLALCFSGLLAHGILPHSLLSVLLVPVIKDKTCKASSTDNYRPIALASIISKVLERIILERLQGYVETTDNQFGFKHKHGTDLCIYALKEIISTYKKKNSTVFTCFLDASKAFDRVNHGKLFLKLHQRGVPLYLIRILQYWYSHQTMQVRWGQAFSSQFLVTNGVRQGGILSPFLLNLYMDDLSRKLKECKTGCMVGDKVINHLLYADDLVVLSPYSAGLQQLLRVCSEYGIEYDIKYNSKKSVVMILRTKEDKKLHFPSFYLNDSELTTVTKAKYLGHILRNDLCDDDDIQRQCCKLYAQANMLARKFHMCTKEVKISLFRTYCTPLYTAHLWCSYSRAKINKIKVAYNDALRILLKAPRWESASALFVSANVPTFQAILRNLMYKFMCRLTSSRNSIILCLTNVKESDTQYNSDIWRHWKSQLYVGLSPV